MGDLVFSKKILAQGISQLGLIEGIRYPLYLFLILLSGLIGLIFVSRFLANKVRFFAKLELVKNSLYQKRWLVFVLAGLNLLVAFLAMIFPAGILSIAFFGDLLPALVGMAASLFLVIDLLFSGQSTQKENKMAQFVSRFSAIIGCVILVVMLLHFIFPTLVLL